MMTLNEITELRKSGELEKACEAARELHEADSSDKSALISLAECVKAQNEKAAKAGDIDKVIECINELASLRLEEVGEAEMNNRIAWDIRQLVLALNRENIFDAGKLDSLFDALTGIAFLKPHRYYSILLDSLMLLHDENGKPWDAFAEVLDWWGPEFFLPEDYLKMRLNNGAMNTSLAERAYTMAVKSILLAAERGIASEEDIERLVGELDNLLVTHPEFRYTLYQKTLLLKALDRMEEAVETAREFVKKYQNHYWAWAKLGDVLDEDNLRMACYCRALTCRANPEQLVDVRIALAPMLYEMGEYAAAKYEIEAIRAVYEKKGRELPESIARLMSMPWYAETQANENNYIFYQENMEPTRDFLFGGVPETAILVSKFNPQKQTVNFVTEDHNRGFFSTKRLNMRFADNQVYCVRFAEEPDGKNVSNVMTIRRVDDPASYEGKLFRKLRSEINIRPGQTFTFVDGIYVDAGLLHNIAPGSMAEITAVAYYNIKKGDWGWRAIRVVPDYDY
ncbi:MAG: hypothetical protein HDS84_05200 [Bacteroidales bacterium]|nr:hypothetical protein [Bacteroidales bacterium]